MELSEEMSNWQEKLIDIPASQLISLRPCDGPYEPLLSPDELINPALQICEFVNHTASFTVNFLVGIHKILRKLFLLAKGGWETKNQSEGNTILLMGLVLKY